RVRSASRPLHSPSLSPVGTLSDSWSPSFQGDRVWLQLRGDIILEHLQIGVTFVVSSANLVYSLWSNKRTVFVNTVTTSRLKWIDSLRDKVSEFIAVTVRLLDPEFPSDKKSIGTLLLQRDTLLHQIVLHLNPHDPEDQRIKTLVDHVQELTDHGVFSDELADGLVKLRDATGDYLKKEWNRVKTESTGKQS
ncbi:MAG TPA: hypothetical protein VII95_06850, partial [Terriglobales bacterium]